MAGSRSPHAPSAHPRCAEAAAAQGEPGTAPRLGVGGSSLDRFRDAGAARQPDRKHAVGVPFSLLEAIAEQADEALQGGLAHLQSAEFLYQSRLFPDVEYTFKHGLTYEVAYGSLLHERRRALHSRIVAVIEARYPDRLNEQVERLAYHAIRGELWEKATRYLSQAGARALDRSAYREAAPYFEQALSALAHLPETLETRGQGVDFRLGLRNSLFPLGEIEAVIRHLQNAEQLATALDDRLRLARVSVATSHHFLVTGNAEEARKFGTRAFEISETIKDHSLRVAANLYLGAACLALGDFRAAEEHLEKTLRFVEGELVHERFGLHGFPSAILGSYLAWGLAERGDFGAAIARGREGVEIAEAVHHAYSQVYASWGLALAHVLRGDLTEAARILERAEALVREWNLPLMDALVLGLLGLVRARTGHADEGVALLQEAVTAYEKAFGGGSGSR